MAHIGVGRLRLLQLNLALLDGRGLNATFLDGLLSCGSAARRCSACHACTSPRAHRPGFRAVDTEVFARNLLLLGAGAVQFKRSGRWKDRLAGEASKGRWPGRRDAPNGSWRCCSATAPPSRSKRSATRRLRSGIDWFVPRCSFSARQLMRWRCTSSRLPPGRPRSSVTSS